LSAVLKVAYDGEVAYVKASCEHFRAEARITEVIAGWPAGAVPDVLAAEADRGWLMMAPLPESVDSVDVADSVVAAAESLALLQLQSVPRHRELPDCPDRTLAKTWTAFAPLVDTSLERDELSAAETGRGPERAAAARLGRRGTRRLRPAERADHTVTCTVATSLGRPERRPLRLVGLVLESSDPRHLPPDRARARRRPCARRGCVPAGVARRVPGCRDRTCPRAGAHR
jgi:hypothetical protein